MPSQDNDPLATVVGLVDSCLWVALEKACMIAQSRDTFARRSECMNQLARGLQKEMDLVIKPLLNV